VQQILGHNSVASDEQITNHEGWRGGRPLWLAQLKKTCAVSAAPTPSASFPMLDPALRRRFTLIRDRHGQREREIEESLWVSAGR